MNDEKKKSPGRPRKYETNAERKKAYRERKKEDHNKLEERAKRITELKGRIDNMERKMVKSTYTDQNVPEEISAVHEQIKDRSRKYSSSELMELEIHELKRIQSGIQSRYHGSYYNPLLAALESALMPSVDREFDSRKQKAGEEIPYDIVVREKLAQSDNDTTPKIETKVEDYMELAKKKGLKISAEDLSVKSSTMEKKNIASPKHWKHLKDIFRTDQLFEVFQEMILLYTVEAEISRREREDSQARDFTRLERRLEELEKTMNDEKLRHVKTFVNKAEKKRKLMKNEKKEKDDENEDE